MPSHPSDVIHPADVIHPVNSTEVHNNLAEANSISAARPHKKKVLTKKLSLLNRLVRSSVFQFLLGNIHWSEIGRRDEKDKIYINVDQSFCSKLVDLFLFAILVIAAPVIALNKLLTTYWARFSFGVVCGVGVLLLVFRIAFVFWSQMNVV